MDGTYWPQNMKYVLNEISSFSRQRSKLQLNFASAKAGDTIYFKIPSGVLFDMSTLGVHFSITTTATGTAGTVLPPCYSSCLIDTLTVDIGGVTVQNIQQYGQLYRLLSHYKAGDTVNRAGFLEWVNMSQGMPGTATVLTNLPLAWKNWLGFLGQNRLVSTDLLGEITVSIRLAPNSCLIGATGTAPTYSLSDMSVQFDVISIDSPTYNQSLMKQMENSGLKLGYQNITTFLGGSSSYPVSSSFSVSTQSLDYLIGTVLRSNFNDSLAGIIHSGNTGTSSYFQCGDGTISSAMFQIGAVQVPGYTIANAAECLAVTLDALSLSQDIVGSSNDMFKPINTVFPSILTGGSWQTASHYANYTNGNFMFAIRTCHGDTSAGPLLSGINTLGNTQTIQFRVTGSGTNQMVPLVYALSTATLTILPGRQLNLTV